MSDELGPCRQPLDPFRRHRRDTGVAVASGDAKAIKRLYADLGDDMWASARVDLQSIPVLSAPEIAPAVTACMDRSGLILDAGSGPNPAASVTIARRPNCRVVATDLGLGMVRTARRIAESRGLTLIGVCADIEHLPFRSGAFDGVICDDTIEHVPDDVAGVRELARTLRVGGLAVVATPNRTSAAVLRARARDVLAGRRRPRSSYFVAESHLREYTWTSFSRLLEGAFVVRSRVPIGWSGARRLQRLTWLFEMPGGRRLCQTLVATAELPANPRRSSRAPAPRLEPAGPGRCPGGPRGRG